MSSPLPLRASAAVPLLFLLGMAHAQSAPRVPAHDTEVVERLRSHPRDPAMAELRRLREQAAAAPGSPGAAAQLARRYFEMAMADGDPRFVGYAQAALRHWRDSAQAPAEILVLRGMLQQYRHDFAGALASLGAALRADPENAEALAWRAAIRMVQADYAGARSECAALRAAGSELQAVACVAYVDATTGNARDAHAALSGALSRRAEVAPEFRLWLLTRLAEMAWRMGDAATAERHFREALALGIADNFLLAAYADFLLEASRPREVVDLLASRVRSDTLLLRLAIAGQALGMPAAARHIQSLGERFAAGALRGERLHLQEEARYLLELKGDARAALAAAQENWKTQREPRDAEILLRAALAARNRAAAEPALEWLRSSGFESAPLAQIASRLRALP